MSLERVLTQVLDKTFKILFHSWQPLLELVQPLKALIPFRFSANYKAIDKEYPVYCGADFWEHLTGDKNFYNRLAGAFGQVVEEDDINGSELILNKINEIAHEIKENGGL